MAFWYVDDSGSNANDGKSSGNPKKYLWLDDGNSALFNEVLDVDKPAAGDIVLVLENHSELHASGGSVYADDGDKGEEDNPIWIVTVDSLSSPTAYGSKGNSEVKNSTGGFENLIISGHMVIQGIKFTATDKLSYSYYAARRIVFIECILKQTRASEYIEGGERCQALLIDTDIELASGSYIGSGWKGSFTQWLGGDLISASTNHFFDMLTEGAAINVFGVDLEACGSYVFSGFATSSAGKVEVSRSRIGSSAVVYNGSPPISYQCIVDGCDDADNYFNYAKETTEGTIEADTTVSRASSTYDGTNPYSILMDSNANTPDSKPGAGLWGKIATLIDQDLSGSVDVTIQIAQWDSLESATPDALDELEFRIGIVRPDGTDQALGVWQFSHDQEVFDASPPDIGASTETWNKTTYIRKQKLTVTIPALSGVTNGQIDVFAFLTKRSVEVNVCADVDIS